MMRFLASLVLVLGCSFSSSSNADIVRIDWGLSSISFGDIAGATYNMARLDIDTGSANSRYFSVGGALVASASASAPVFPVTGTCLSLPESNIRCSLMFERGALVIDATPSLSGSFRLVNQSGTTTQSGTVIYTGIVQ